MELARLLERVPISVKDSFSDIVNEICEWAHEQLVGFSLSDVLILLGIE